MSFNKVVSQDDAIALVRDGDVLCTTGYGGNGTPDQLLIALEQRFLDTQSPRDLTLVYAGGQGDADERGLNHLAYEGLLKRVIGGHYGLIPKLEKLAVENKVEAYNFPEGAITHLYRDIAGGKAGTLSKVGIGTFVDPRIEGGKVNEAAKEDLIELVELAGEESLFYKSFPVNVVFIRGTTADADGNVTMEKESLRLENLSLALAARNSGGIVICQVERVAESGSLDARRVRIPGVLVDCIVVATSENHMQTYGTQYNPAMSGEVRVPLNTLSKLPLDIKKVIARRAAMEITPNSVINLGVGMPDLVGNVANEENIHDLMTLTVDPGVFGGVPMGGLDFGASVNFSASIDHPYQFDFIDGGGLDCAVLGFAECDALGSVNASKFGNRLSGCGGFINITQNSKSVIFVGTFTAGGLKISVENGELVINQEGKFRKFVEQIGQITFSGPYAASHEKRVLYVTERCVFKLQKEGLALIEVAPGIDLQRDILDHLPFVPVMEDVGVMDPALFVESQIGLRARLMDLNIEDRIRLDADGNSLFLDFSGMRVRSTRDIDEIINAVDATLKPHGRRVTAIVNYDSFSVDTDVADQYMDAVQYVEKTYYDKVSRYTTSGFMRLKLAHELGKRDVTTSVVESHSDAKTELET